MNADSTAVLRDEHRWILKVVDVLDAHLARPDLDFELLEKCCRFFRLFADQCHHGKEEDLLFPALEDHGMSREAGPIAVMLHEHRIGREYVAAMTHALQGAATGDADARARLENASRGYVDLIRGHIGKEDHVLFQMADGLLGAPACRRLCAAYDETLDHTFEGCTKAQLERLGEEIAGPR